MMAQVDANELKKTASWLNKRQAWNEIEKPVLEKCFEETMAKIKGGK
jgi:hypothetical protein